MTLLFPSKASFVSGQLSPRLFGRIDLDQYTTGLEQCTNFVVYPHGGATFRSGTRFITEIKNSANYVRLLPFIFSNDQAYVLEFGLNYIRFINNYNYVEDPGSPPDPLEEVTTYTLDEVDSLDYDQSGDIMYLVTRSQAPATLSRTANDDWDFADFVFQDGPYEDINITATTLTPSATSGSVTVTASSIVGINGGTGFQTTDVGRLIRFQHVSTWSWGEITARASTTSVTVLITGTTTDLATANWRLGAWSETTGYPEAVAFHQQRLFFGRGQNVWGSRTGDFTNFAPSATDGTVVDDDAVTYKLAAGRIDLIQWLASGRVLEIGTAGAEFTMSGGGSFGSDNPLTPDSVVARKATQNGSFEVGKPIFTSRGTVFINRSGRKLFNYFYSFENDNYTVDDITLLSEDISYPNVFELAYQAEPDMLIWTLRSDGTLLSCTFNPAQSVVAWGEHVIGGSDGEGTPIVESITVIPAQPDPGDPIPASHDELWLSIRRTVNGNTVRYIEVLEALFTPLAEIEDALFLDSALSYSGAAADSFTGLDHLEGQVVSILADGSVHPDKTVSTGTVTLDYLASDVSIGLKYQGKLILLPFEPGDLGNALTSRKTRVVSVGLVYYRTVLGEVGIEGKQLELFNGRISSDPMDDPREPMTGFVRVPVESNSEYRNRITIEQNYPLPCTILSVLPIIEN